MNIESLDSYKILGFIGIFSKFYFLFKKAFQKSLTESEIFTDFDPLPQFDRYTKKLLFSNEKLNLMTHKTAIKI